MTRRATSSIVASPVLVGAVTMLVTIIAVFLAYNANSGLPFVPTYDLKAQLPTGGKLVAGNEVRVGGFRVGVVEEIEPVSIAQDGRRGAHALVRMKLDKVVEPLSTDSKLRVRPRSALGLKYIELSPGRSRDRLQPGSTIPLRNTSEPLELEDVFDTFDRDTRPAVQAATEGFGDAFAGRGQSINVAVEALNPLFRSLTPVMRNLADPDTRLENFFRQLGGAAAQVAPVADVQARLFTNMADTFAAIGRSPRALQLTIEKSPATLDTSISSFRAQRPFLGDLIDLSNRLRPAARELPRSLPAINSAFRVGTPILPRTVELNRNVEASLEALDDLFENPNTLLALRDIRSGLAVTRPLLEFVAPYQTVCNYGVYFIHALSEHQSAPVEGSAAAFGGGTVQGQGVKETNGDQPNSLGGTDSSRPADIPPAGDRPPGWEDTSGPQDSRGVEYNNPATPTPGGPAAKLFGTPYPPAIDAQGNADCQLGQTGFPNGPLTVPWVRYGGGYAPAPAPQPPSSSAIPTGGNWAIAIDDYPVLTGGTYKARQLGINNLRDVP
jgi:virulence factor Mce-like protein